MAKSIFDERRYVQKFDNGQYVGYINEEVDDNYIPDYPDMEDADKTPRKVYKYDEVIIESPDMTRDNLVNGLIRLTYSNTQELAMIRHHADDAEKYADEWKEYNDTVDKAKAEVDRWLSK